jgi:FkbH-like protein
LYTLSKTLYTIDFWKKYTYVVSPLLLKLTGRSKKAIIFDCDNTLWHGILGEDGFNGIDMSFQSKIGAIFNKIQQIAVWLSKHGVIVGLCSKNNPEDIQDVLENHPDIVLTNKYIVVSEVNWNDKVSNLKSIAETLNIGLDSILFIDDSSFEINLVKEQLPLVKCIQVPDAIYDYPNYLMNEINKYFYFSDSKDDLDKTEQYKQQANRNKAKSQFNDIESFLSSLNIEISIAEDSRIDIERIAQLTQKTNQFNLCTNRYTDTQIQNFMDDVNHTIYSITVRDKFGCSGLTAVVIISIQNNSATIKDFIMSCRIMGRNIEYAIMYYLIGKLHEQGIDLVNADYVPTAKNKPVRDFYDSLGFNLCSEHSDIKHYSLDLQTYAPKEITYIKIV